ncbi:DUF5384 family protein [Proteus alimentorum]|uniref:DUF5384 family protein n=1 Tax=Proteus alimentorum TaxID=1973495 RepID=UPI000C000137|nr:DUF5384 family protein [Proteus alimentorum]
MNKTNRVLLISLLAFSFSNYSHADLNSQLQAVAAAEREGELAKTQARDKLQAEAKAKAEAQARANAQAREAAQARANAQAKAAAAEKEKAYNEFIKDKAREQSFEDELRMLELEERKLELARKKARVNREDDFIDQELKRQAAHTDVIQSDADAQRSIANGTESLLTKEGEARVKKESGFFK